MSLFSINTLLKNDIGSLANNLIFECESRTRKPVFTEQAVSELIDMDELLSSAKYAFKVIAFVIIHLEKRNAVETKGHLFIEFAQYKTKCLHAAWLLWGV